MDKCLAVKVSTKYRNKNAGVIIMLVMIDSIVVDCGLLDSPIEGSINFVNGTTTYQSVVIYSCSPRYGVSGSTFRTCLGNGLWSGNESVCVGKSSVPSKHIIHYIFVALFCFRCLQ